MGFPGGSDSKESTCNVGGLCLIPGLGRSPGEGKGYPLPYSGLENSTDCDLPGPSVHGIHQAIILERVAMPSSRRSSQPRDRTQVSNTAGRFFTARASEVFSKHSWINKKAHHSWGNQRNKHLKTICLVKEIQFKETWTMVGDTILNKIAKLYFKCSKNSSTLPKNNMALPI